MMKQIQKLGIDSEVLDDKIGVADLEDYVIIVEFSRIFIINIFGYYIFTWYILTNLFSSLLINFLISKLLLIKTLIFLFWHLLF